MKINDIRDGPIIFIANEFFDALAIKQFYKKKGLFFEKHVSLASNKWRVAQRDTWYRHRLDVSHFINNYVLRSKV